MEVVLVLFWLHAISALYHTLAVENNKYTPLEGLRSPEAGVVLIKELTSQYSCRKHGVRDNRWELRGPAS